MSCETEGDMGKEAGGLAGDYAHTYVYVLIISNNNVHLLVLKTLFCNLHTV